MFEHKTKRIVLTMKASPVRLNAKNGRLRCKLKRSLNLKLYLCKEYAPQNIENARINGYAGSIL